MKKLSLILLFISATKGLWAQNVQITSQWPTTERKRVNTFDLIDNMFDTTGLQKIATLTGFSMNERRENIASLYNAFWNKANLLGANSYVINNISKASDTTSMAITIYYINDPARERNLERYPKNMLYIVGDIDKNQKDKTIRLNDKKIVLKPMCYLAYQNKVGGEAIVSIGGFLGTKVWIVGKAGRLPTHLSVNGFGVGPGAFNTSSISFNTGRIYPVEMSFGQFLVKVLTRQD